MNISIFVGLIMVLGGVMCRGPHHPRGTKVSRQHTHYKPTKGQEGQAEKLTQDTELLHDTEHLQEELGDWAQDKDLSQMSDEELEFHYFQLHDFDNNSRLDGLEILQAIHHIEHDEGEETEEDKSDFEYYVQMIDRVLEEDDTDADGYLSYPEYVAGRKKDKVANIGESLQKSPSVIQI